MRKAKVYNFGIPAGELIEIEPGRKYKFVYYNDYKGKPISLTMPVNKKEYEFDEFPPFFDGLLPEGVQLEALVRQMKIDKNDYFSQLVCVGKDLVGSVTVEEVTQ
ncbi:MAG: HipA N-terminal domain-containing protein [Ignavibacterium sp.]|jgi:serine/threonine-protein kinase HipA|uniref:HipA N-terminal domain-containing protein n=1 Tax=Ignavibacterium sp. TaxID=2651167 RepID=UPI0032993628